MTDGQLELTVRCTDTVRCERYGWYQTVVGEIEQSDGSSDSHRYGVIFSANSLDS